MGDRSMRAVVVEGGRGGPEALVLGEIARPEPGPGQILIKVAAAGVNRPDVLQRQGHYPPPPGSPETLGLEVAGEVVETGPGASRWKVGDQVCALMGGGGYAEYAVADARHALPIPAGLSLDEAAGLPETVFTVFTNVFERGHLKAGETFVVHGATSGIGVTAIKLAKAVGARVITTSRGAAKTEQAKALGADVAIDASVGDWLEKVEAEGGADVVLDMVGQAYTARNLKCLKLEGRLVQVSFLTGSNVELDLRRLMVERLTITGSTLRPRSADEKARLAAAVEKAVWPWIEQGQVRLPIDSVYPLGRATDAHRRMESGEHLGKIVLQP